jgi:hypothetical protein
VRPSLRLVPSASPRAAVRRAAPPAVRQAIAAAERGLEIVGTRWAVWLAHQFLHDAQFRAAMPREPFRISRYDWIIFPPPHPISWPPGEPARLVPLPPLRIDPRCGLRLPPAKLGQPRKRSQGAQLSAAGGVPRFDDPLFLDGLMVFVQAMVDGGQKLNVVLRGFADELKPTPRQRAMVEVQLHRAWARHRKARQRTRRLGGTSRLGNDLHDLSRKHGVQC